MKVIIRIFESVFERRDRCALVVAVQRDDSVHDIDVEQEQNRLLARDQQGPLCEPLDRALFHARDAIPSIEWLIDEATDAWLLEAVHDASRRHFGRPAMFNGLGGSIPFMAMLGERFPRAQFFITGTGGPGSNAHGPNEFLHVPFAERLTACVADLIAAHHRARNG